VQSQSTSCTTITSSTDYTNAALACLGNLDPTTGCLYISQALQCYYSSCAYAPSTGSFTQSYCQNTLYPEQCSAVQLFSSCGVSCSGAPPLPSNCTTPVGNCNFYLSCLETTIPCACSSYRYATDYGYHFCSLYGQNLNSFSQYGQQWIAAVRLCLQQALVPELTLAPPPSCKQLQDYAFATHTDCYTQPQPGVSVCLLSITDKAEVFWTIKGAFLPPTLFATLGQMGQAFAACGPVVYNAVKLEIQNVASSAATSVANSIENSINNFIENSIHNLIDNTFSFPTISVISSYDFDFKKRDINAGPTEFLVLILGNSTYPANSTSNIIMNGIQNQTLLQNYTVTVTCSGNCTLNPVSTSSSSSFFWELHLPFLVMLFSLNRL